jgi:hypothetical protein
MIENIRPAIEVALVAVVIVHILHTGRSVRTLRSEFQLFGEKLENVVDKVDELNRAELLQMLGLTAKEAEQSIIHYTYTFNVPEDEPEMGPLLDAIRSTKIPKKNVRFLGPDYTENLNRLYSRKQTGAQVRVSHAIRNSDLRFQVVDSRRVVITVGAASERSKRGYLVESVFLSRILTKWFDQEWEQSQDYDEYVCQMISATMKIPEIEALQGEKRIEYIAARLGLDAAEVRRLYQAAGSDRTPARKEAA